MKYKVLSDNTVIHDPLFDIYLIDPVLQLTDNLSGTFEFGIAPNNPGYAKLQKLTSIITVFRDGEELYCGRPLTEHAGLEGMKVFKCEGELGILLDSIQRQGEYRNKSINDFLNILITNHNNMTEPSKHFAVGNVTVRDPNDSIYRCTNFERTWDAVFEKLVDIHGGHIKLRKENGVRYVDYLEDYGSVSKQIIELGENLLDLTEETTAGDIATVLIPLGARLEKQGEAEEMERYLTIEDVNDGKDYLENPEAIKRYGRIVRTIHFDNVTLPDNLKTKGQEYFKSVQFETLTLNLEAVDLSLLDINIQPLRVRDKIRVKSSIHGLDSYFPLLQRTYNLNNPSLDRIVLGDTRSKTIYDIIGNGDKDNTKLTMEQAKASNAYTEAVRYFSAVAASMVGCYETVQKEDGASIRYRHDRPELSLSSYICKSNAAGMFFTTEGINSKNWKGVDKYGNALLESLTAKTISADTVKAGILKSNNPDSNVFFDLNRGILSSNKLVSDLYPDFSMTIGPSVTRDSGAIDVIAKQKNLLSVYVAASDSDEGTIITAPWKTNGGGTNRKGIAIFSDRISMFADGMGRSNGVTVTNDGRVEIQGDLTVKGDFTANGQKDRAVKTSVGTIGIAAYETAEPIFGDIGEAKTGEDGTVQIDIDSLFNETVNTTDCPYQVFLQPYTDGHFWVSKRAANHFVVNGPTNSAFAWEIKAHQKNYEQSRLVKYD